MAQYCLLQMPSFSAISSNFTRRSIITISLTFLIISLSLAVFDVQNVVHPLCLVYRVKIHCYLWLRHSRTVYSDYYYYWRIFVHNLFGNLTAVGAFKTSNPGVHEVLYSGLFYKYSDLHSYIYVSLYLKKNIIITYIDKFAFDKKKIRPS